MHIQDQTSPIRRVLVRPPVAGDLKSWADYGWHDAPDPRRASEEHEAFRVLLSEAGAQVVVGETPVHGDPDAIYAYDPALMTDEGAILLSPGKTGRRDEPVAFAEDLVAAGVTIAGHLTDPATAEGGDMFWLDSTTLLVGRGYRTNDAGVAQLRDLLAPSGARVLSFDLPHLGGPDECVHLMSFISPLDVDLAVAYLPLMPVRLVELLRERSVTLIDVPPEEFPTMGPNVLALGPRIALALDGNPRTRKAMEAAGVDVRVFAGYEICYKGDGGPTCLTRPLERL